MIPAPRRAGFALVAIAFLLVSCAAPRAAAAWTWLPGDRTVPAPLADPREPTLGFEAVEGGLWSARVGTGVAIGRGSRVEVGLDGFAWLWFSSLPRFNFPLETVDGTFGFWAGAPGKTFGWRVRYAHWSGHLGDGASEIEERRIVYSRESITALGFWRPNPHLELYAGPAAFVRADPNTQAFQFQAGGELRPDRGLPPPADGRRVDPFFAFDLRAKAENDMRVNQTYRAGLRFTGAPGGNAFRVQLGYDNGMCERGQEWATPRDYVSLGCSFGR